MTLSLVHSSDGKISLRPIDLDGDSNGMQRFTHVLEEMVTCH